jgi:ABC-type thiamin/hydroxymethylpyrimidine transport system permease subunit
VTLPRPAEFRRAPPASSRRLGLASWKCMQTPFGCCCVILATLVAFCLLTVATLVAFHSTFVGTGGCLSAALEAALPGLPDRYDWYAGEAEARAALMRLLAQDRNGSSPAGPVVPARPRTVAGYFGPYDVFRIAVDGEWDVGWIDEGQAGEGADGAGAAGGWGGMVVTARPQWLLPVKPEDYPDANPANATAGVRRLPAAAGGSKETQRRGFGLTYAAALAQWHRGVLAFAAGNASAAALLGSPALRRGGYIGAFPASVFRPPMLPEGSKDGASGSALTPALAYVPEVLASAPRPPAPSAAGGTVGPASSSSSSSPPPPLPAEWIVEPLVPYSVWGEDRVQGDFAPAFLFSGSDAGLKTRKADRERLGYYEWNITLPLACVLQGSQATRGFGGLALLRPMDWLRGAVAATNEGSVAAYLRKFFLAPGGVGASPAGFIRFLVSTGILSFEGALINMAQWTFPGRDGRALSLFTLEQWTWGPVAEAGAYWANPYATMGAKIGRLLLRPFTLVLALVLWFLASTTAAAMVRVFSASGVVIIYPLLACLWGGLCSDPSARRNGAESDDDAEDGDSIYEVVSDADTPGPGEAAAEQDGGRDAGDSDDSNGLRVGRSRNTSAGLGGAAAPRESETAEVRQRIALPALPPPLSTGLYCMACIPCLGCCFRNQLMGTAEGEDGERWRRRLWRRRALQQGATGIHAAQSGLRSQGQQAGAPLEADSRRPWWRRMEESLPGPCTRRGDRRRGWHGIWTRPASGFGASLCGSCLPPRWNERVGGWLWAVPVLGPVAARLLFRYTRLEDATDVDGEILAAVDMSARRSIAPQLQQEGGERDWMEASHAVPGSASESIFVRSHPALLAEVPGLVDDATVLDVDGMAASSEPPSDGPTRQQQRRRRMRRAVVETRYMVHPLPPPWREANFAFPWLGVDIESLHARAEHAMNEVMDRSRATGGGDSGGPVRPDPNIRPDAPVRAPPPEAIPLAESEAIAARISARRRRYAEADARRLAAESLNWLANRESRMHIYAHLQNAMLAFLGYQCMGLVVPYFFLGYKSQPEGFSVSLWGLALLAEYYAFVCVRSRASIATFPRAACCIFVAVFLYNSTAPYPFSDYACVAGVFATLALALFCVLAFEVPALKNQSVSAESPRACMYQTYGPSFPWSTPNIWTTFTAVNHNFRTLYDSEVPLAPAAPGAAAEMQNGTV